MLSKLPKWEKVEKQTTEVVVTHIVSHPLVVEEEVVVVELLYEEEEPLKLVLVVEEAWEDVVLVLAKESGEAED